MLTVAGSRLKNCVNFLSKYTSKQIFFSSNKHNRSALLTRIISSFDMGSLENAGNEKMSIQDRLALITKNLQVLKSSCVYLSVLILNQFLLEE